MKITESKKIDSCLITGKPITKVFEFGQHAYADTFISENQLNLSEPAFPLDVYLCPESGHLQLGYVSNAEDRYNLYTYSYTSSNSAYSRKHWDAYAAQVKERYNPTNFVVEVGSNDGYLVGQFKDTCKVLGVDTSQVMCDIAAKNGVQSFAGVFTEEIAKSIVNAHGYADVVIANNVFNHANDPVDFTLGAAALIGDNGKFIFEMPYWKIMVESGRFVDMVYHEHISYFTAKSVNALMERCGLTIVEFEIADYHGGSLRIVAEKAKGQTINTEVLEAITAEEELGLFDPQFYHNLFAKFKQDRVEWLAKFYEIKKNDSDVVIIGVGAAAKANTWLVWHGLNKNDLRCITDSSEFKQGKYTPLTRIPIRGDEEFANHENPYALILSWNISEGLKNALLKINPNTRFLSQ